jgi:hypothetical protein
VFESLLDDVGVLGIFFDDEVVPFHLAAGDCGAAAAGKRVAALVRVTRR